ncbi:MAG: DUF2520 domain-containing protein [Muribaculaceae bacterium]|nr:DUF2520 domain-containing protein [Muribaculaceae bacterium]
MKVAIVGNGNVASHLFQALRDKIETVLVNSRTLEGFPPDADIVLISVSDNAIEEVFSRLPHTAAVMAHTAGSVPMDVLNKNVAGYGVFYPLQTFTKGVELNYREIPVFIEGNSQETVERLKALASLFSDNVKEADSEARKKLHLASVFACNFSNALAGISQEILKESALDFKDLLPLMKQTINKLASLSATEAQTGPAVRGDTKVMNAHLKMLEDKPLFQEIYTLLSDYISDTKKKERL